LCVKTSETELQFEPLRIMAHEQPFDLRQDLR
jgi:hypothetical protein